MIVGWIMSSIEAKVRSTVTFISDSHKLWENLKKRFSVGNKVRVHHIKEQLLLVNRVCFELLFLELKLVDGTKIDLLYLRVAKF